MTIEIAGTWELGWSAPMTESDMWRMPLREFGLDNLNMCPVTGLDKRWITEYKDFDTLISDKKDLTPVFVSEKGETELRDFEHPDEALYIFGKVAFSPFNDKMKGYKSIRIKSNNSVKPGMLWPHQALAIVLYDRGCKYDNNISYR